MAIAKDTQFANRYGLNVEIYASTDAEMSNALMTIDFANVSDISLSGDRTWATGGQDHANRIGFNNPVEGTFKLSTQIMTMELLNLMAGGTPGAVLLPLCSRIPQTLCLSISSSRLRLFGRMPMVLHMLRRSRSIRLAPSVPSISATAAMATPRALTSSLTLCRIQPARFLLLRKRITLLNPCQHHKIHEGCCYYRHSPLSFVR